MEGNGDVDDGPGCGDGVTLVVKWGRVFLLRFGSAICLLGLGFLSLARCTSYFKFGRPPARVAAQAAEA